MEFDEFIEAYDRLYNKKREMLAKKSNDYANDEDNFACFRSVARIADIDVEKVFLVWLATKMVRLRELTSDKEPMNESIQDTLEDLSNYADLMNIFLQEKEKKAKEYRKLWEKHGPPKFNIKLLDDDDVDLNEIENELSDVDKNEIIYPSNKHE